MMGGIPAPPGLTPGPPASPRATEASLPTRGQLRAWPAGSRRPSPWRKPKEEAPADVAPPVEATPPAEATPPPPKPQHLTVKIEIGDGTGEPTKVLLSVAGAAA